MNLSVVEKLLSFVKAYKAVLILVSLLEELFGCRVMVEKPIVAK